MNSLDKENKAEREALVERFGIHLKELRTKKKISAAELSRRTFIEKPNITRIEKGGINPSLFVLKKLADGLEITLEELLKGFK